MTGGGGPAAKGGPGSSDSLELVIRTLVFTDLVESVRLMEANETDLVRRWRKLVCVVERDILPAHSGRLIKNMGDGQVLEFVGVDSAIRAAFAIRLAFANANRELPPDCQMLLRTGVHVGQLIACAHDFYGRGVNLAARLTTLAGPGEIVMSADVRDQLTPALDADIEDLGLCFLKHVHAPVRAYRLGPPGPRPVLDGGTRSMLSCARRSLSFHSLVAVAAPIAKSWATFPLTSSSLRCRIRST